MSNQKGVYSLCSVSGNSNIVFQFTEIVLHSICQFWNGQNSTRFTGKGNASYCELLFQRENEIPAIIYLHNERESDEEKLNENKKKNIGTGMSDENCIIGTGQKWK